MRAGLRIPTSPGMRRDWNVHLFERGDWRRTAVLVLIGLLALPVAFLIITMLLLGGLVVGLVMLAGVAAGALLRPRRTPAQRTPTVIDVDYTVVAEGDRTEQNPWARRER